MAIVRLAPVLRPSAGGSKLVTAEGSTLREVLLDLYRRYPALQEQIQPKHDSNSDSGSGLDSDSEPELSRFVNVYVNDQDVRYLQGLDTAVGANDTVTLLPAMAGGCYTVDGHNMRFSRPSELAISDRWQYSRHSVCSSRLSAAFGLKGRDVCATAAY
jgi:sulfur-carrier protein